MASTVVARKAVRKGAESIELLPMDPSDQKVAGRAERGLSDGDNVEGATAARGREGAVLFVRLHFQEDGDRLTDLSLPASSSLFLSS